MSCQYIKMLSNCALDDTATYAQLKFHYSYWLYIQRKNVLNNIKQIYFYTNKYFNTNKYFIQNTWRCETEKMLIVLVLIINNLQLLPYNLKYINI